MRIESKLIQCFFLFQSILPQSWLIPSNYVYLKKSPTKHTSVHIKRTLLIQNLVFRVS